MQKSSASSERCIIRGCTEQIALDRERSFAQENGSETHEYLVQLVWQCFVLTEGQCWSLVLVEAQKGPDPLDCRGAAP